MFNWGKNLINGLFDGFNPVGMIQDFFENTIMQPLRHLWGMILKGIYMLWSTMASILDTIQIIYNMMVGTSEVVWQSSSAMGQDVMSGSGVLGANMAGVSNNLVVDVFLSQYVLGALLKVIVLSLFLLLIFTMIAIVKIEYSTPHNYSDPKSSTSKRPIIESAIKSLLSFILIPLACIFGVIASGVLMQAIDGATSPTNSTVISNKIFAICSYDANRVRTDDSFYAGLVPSDITQGQYDSYDLSNNYEWNQNFASIGADRNKLAEYIDNLFINGTSLDKAGITQDGDNYKFKGENDVFGNYSKNGEDINKNSFFNIKNASQVFYFYDLAHFQWLIGFFTIFYMCTILIRITLGAAGRIFELAILFVISPAILAMAPLDGGKAMDTWKKKFIGKVGMIYAPVVAINLYFILVGVLVQVDFGSSIDLAISKGFGSDISITGTGLTNVFVQQIFNLFILIAGLQVCESSIKWLSEIIGAEDINAAGAEVRKSMSNFVQTNAAAKYLASGAGKAKSAALSVAAMPGAKMKSAMANTKNSKLTSQMQTEATAKFQKGIKERNDKVRDINGDKEELNNKLNDINHNTDQLRNTVENYSSTSGTSEEALDAYNKNLSQSQAKFASRTDLTEEQRNNLAADEAMQMTQTMDGGKFVSQMHSALSSPEGLDEFRSAAASQRARKESEEKANEVRKQIQDKDKEISKIDEENEKARHDYEQEMRGLRDKVNAMSRDERRAANRDTARANSELDDEALNRAAGEAARTNRVIRQEDHPRTATIRPRYGENEEKVRKSATKNMFRYGDIATTAGKGWEAGGSGGGDKKK